jgi:hypothetical protein
VREIIFSFQGVDKRLSQSPQGGTILPVCVVRGELISVSFLMSKLKLLDWIKRNIIFS